jgi:murein L,D-transpeptidase YcbB/YkuD
MGPAAVINSLRPVHQQYVALAKQLAKAKSKEKARKIMVNMERWRWLPRDMGRRHVLVNQPAYEMYIRVGETIVDRRKVVVGKPYHKTPMFSYALKYAEFNPTWTVPRSIAGEEFLPKLRRNPSYLSNQGYKIYSSWEEDAEELDVKSVNWSRVNSKDFPYRIVQVPGKRNALGKVKFMFPNRFKVYLHDTPSKKLFSSASRAYSHGCIRVEKPLEFATKLFSSQLLSKSKIDKILATENTTKVKLRKAVPIHLTYFTMWVEANGKLKSYKDVYKRDRLVGNILFGRAS